MASENFSNSFEIQRGSEVEYDHSCSTCKTQGLNVEAVSLCQDCDEFMCTRCLEYHNKFAKMKTHTVLDKDAMANKRISLPLPTMKCLLHQGNTVDFFCEEHDAAMCGTCANIDHKKCKRILYIPKVSQGIRQSPEYTDTKAQVHADEVNLKRKIQQGHEELTLLKQDKNTAYVAIGQFKTTMTNLLDYLEKKAKESVDNLYQSLHDQIDSNIQRLEDVQAALESSLESLETCEAENESELFVHIKHGEKHIADGRNLLRITQPWSKRSTLKYQPNENLKEYMKTTTSIGDVIEEKIYTASLLGEFNMKINKGDKLKCDIVSCCQQENGTVMAVDGTNQRLKRLNNHYAIKDALDLPASPNGICAISNNEVAVTLYNKSVQFVSVDKKLSLSRRLNVKGECEGIAYSSGRLYVGLINPGALNIYTTTGELLKKIENYATGIPIFSAFPRQVSTSPDQLTIYVADNDHDLMSFDIDGHLLTKNADDELFCSTGVTAANNGTILVSGKESKNIVQFSSSGRKMAVILDEIDGIDRTYSLCFDRVNSRLIVTTIGDEKIKVFSMA